MTTSPRDVILGALEAQGHTVYWLSQHENNPVGKKPTYGFLNGKSTVNAVTFCAWLDLLGMKIVMPGEDTNGQAEDTNRHSTRPGCTAGSSSEEDEEVPA